MKSGHVPGAEVLGRIVRVENCSLDWLILGIGAPYLVHRCDTDAQTAQTLRAHLDDEAWRVWVLTDGHRGAVVLHQPAEIDTSTDGEKGETIHYTAVELVAGPCGLLTAQVLQPVVGGVTHIPEHKMEDVIHGRVGSVEALELIAQGKDSGAQSEQMLAEVSQHCTGSTMPPDLAEWMAAYDKLSPQNRMHARAVVHALVSADERLEQEQGQGQGQRQGMGGASEKDE